MITPLLFAAAVAVAGDWTGTSTCTNLNALPACHDEVVLYHFTPKGENVFHVAADKQVDGKWELMGEFDMTLEGSHLINEMVDRQGRRATWDFELKGDRIDGRLTMRGEMVRKIDAKKK